MDILLIAGLWLDGSVWDNVAAQLEARGHRAVPSPCRARVTAMHPRRSRISRPRWSRLLMRLPAGPWVDDAAKRTLASAAIPVPEGVTRGVIRLADERRYDVPVVLICPEFTPAQAREWIEHGQVPEPGAGG